MRLILSLLLPALLLTACRSWQTQSNPPAVPSPTYRHNTDASAPTTAPEVMAKVNGQPIPMKQLVDPLLEAYGLGMAEMLVHDALVEQEAVRRGISVTSADIAAEHERTLEMILGQQKVPPDQRGRVLEELLARRGLTRPLWDATMRRNALLRKMVEPQVNITDAMVQAEYSRQYGERVQIRHIQVPSVTEAEKVIELLNRNDDFVAMARKYSANETTAKEGGLLPPFTRDNPGVPRAMRDAAFALKQGQVSGIVQIGGDFHVLRLEKRIPATQQDYEKVEDDLRKAMQQSRTEQLKQELLMELRRKAGVDYVNPILRKASASARAGQ